MVSVILPTLNRRESLIQCLNALEEQTFQDFEVIVIDDGSTDGTAEAVVRWAEGNPTHKPVVFMGSRKGPGAARNLGVERATGEILALIEDDVLPDQSWLANGVDHLMDSRLDAVEGITKLHDPHHPLRAFEGSYQLGFLPCNLFVRTEVFRQLGGYDTSFYEGKHRIYFREDVEFGFRFLERKHKAIVAGDVTVVHPALYKSIRDCFRHARRHYFDPLLIRKHHDLFRRMIEVKRIGPITIHRPFHLMATLSVTSMTGLFAGLLLPDIRFSIASAMALVLAQAGVRYRYERGTWPPMWRVLYTLAFLFLPFYYWYWFLRGCIRFRSWAAIV